MNSVFISNSPKNTREIAAQLAATLSGGEVIAFYGDLGQGKTCFVTGLAEGLGFTGEVSSPTFAIINEYLGGRLDLYHFDSKCSTIAFLCSKPPWSQPITIFIILPPFLL